MQIIKNESRLYIWIKSRFMDVCLGMVVYFSMSRQCSCLTLSHLFKKKKRNILRIDDLPER